MRAIDWEADACFDVKGIAEAAAAARSRCRANGIASARVPSVDVCDAISTMRRRYERGTRALLRARLVLEASAASTAAVIVVSSSSVRSPP